MAIANPQTTAVTINLNLNLNPDQEGHNIFYLLNRIRMNCRRLMFPQLLDHLASALRDSLQTVYNTTLNMEKVLFGNGYAENSPLPTQLSSCYEILRSLMPRFIEQVSLDGSSITKDLGFANVLHVVFLVFCDLHLIEALKLLRPYDYKNILEGTPAIVYKLSQTQQDQFCKVVQKRQQQLVTKAQITLPTPKSISKVDSYDMKQLVDETFNPLTNKLVPQSRRQLASIMAYDECICTELRKLKDQLQKVKALTSDQSYACRSKLSFLMDRIDQEINQFILGHFAGEFPLANPRPSNITSSVNISPRFDPLSQPGDDHKANSCSTDDGSFSYPMTENDVSVNEDDDSFDLSDFMEPCEEQDLDSANPPPLYLETIDRLCNENDVKDAVWSRSTRKPNLIVVNGKGITDEKKEKLENITTAEFPDFQTEFINAELSSQNLTGLVLQSTCNKQSPSPRWEPHEKATCEILLTGQQPHRSNREVVYAVTSAHLLLSREEMIELENVDDSLQQLKLEVSRDEVNKRIGEHVYSFSPRSANGTLPLTTVNLCNPALLAFRTCQHAAPTLDTSQSDIKRYDYMSDITLIPMESGNEQLMHEWFKSTNMNLIEGIHTFKPGQFEKFIASKAKVYAHNREGKAIPLPTDVNPTTSKPRAIHLPFVLTRGERFQPGDSGSLIYARLGGSDNRRLAIGILKGCRPPPEDHVFEAILLRSAMEDLEHDYRHLVNSLKLYKGCQARKSGSTGPVPVKTAHKT